MSGAGKVIALDDARAGMVLAADLCDDGGAVLLPAGATLSDASLKSLGRRGVASLSVQDAGDGDGAPSEAEQLRRCARLERLFRRSMDVGASAALFGYLQRFRKEG